MDIRRIESGKRDFLPLLLLGDEQEDMIDRYLERGTMYVLEDGGVEDITLLHCNTEYPTPFADANLRAMQDLASHFGCAVGYSDHTLGWEADIAAVALGACVIEKHFTLDKTLEGPDHKAWTRRSLRPWCARCAIRSRLWATAASM